MAARDAQIHKDIIARENGNDYKMSEDGTYDELISLNGYFADLVSRQRLDK